MTNTFPFLYTFDTYNLLLFTNNAQRRSCGKLKRLLIPASSGVDVFVFFDSSSDVFSVNSLRRVVIRIISSLCHQCIDFSTKSPEIRQIRVKNTNKYFAHVFKKYSNNSRQAHMLIDFLSVMKVPLVLLLRAHDQVSREESRDRMLSSKTNRLRNY
jgi:hypothetical protein